MTFNPSDSDLKWEAFTADISTIELPQKFTFPFYYEPHALAKIAAAELQQFLNMEWAPELGIFKSEEETVVGKMFGVLVVRNKQNQLGYLTAYSGKLPSDKQQSRFVPPIFDLFAPDSFFLEGEKEINAINFQIETLEQDGRFLELKDEYVILEQQAKQSILAKKEVLKKQKKERKKQRILLEASTDSLVYQEYNADLIKQSLRDKHELNVLVEEWNNRLDQHFAALNTFESMICKLRDFRKNKSHALQNRLFEQYQFLNALSQRKDVLTIFKETALLQPPAAAGDCAAPRLLQYAYQNHLEPIAMAEFWWGPSPKSEIRKHGYFYPACRGKCEPILNYMLQGLTVDDNPLLVNPALGVDLEIIYEDADMVVINKPAEFLSVPGIYIQDSVYQRMKERYPKATGPLIIHRLDMATSGILVIAKTKEAHQHLQAQFINRSVKKRYVALLNGFPNDDKGEIDLPLRVDLDDRPRQLVCYEYGKPAQTQWQVIERREQHTLVHFWPITGRTHQLRVHAAHNLGLGCAILGDDLYGQKSTRLFLHAESLELTHPTNLQKMIFEAKHPF